MESYRREFATSEHSYHGLGGASPATPRGTAAGQTGITGATLVEAGGARGGGKWDKRL